MKVRDKLAALAVLGVVGVAFAGGAAAKPENFRAHLNGDNEVPAVDTRAQGQAILQLAPDGASMDFKLIVANIENITQAHIHCGAAGVNGPVVVFLFGFISMGVDVNGILAEGTVVANDVIPRPDSAACPGGLADFDELLDRIRAGEAYVNVHTEQNPGGEVRGQIR